MSGGHDAADKEEEEHGWTRAAAQPDEGIDTEGEDGPTQAPPPQGATAGAPRDPTPHQGPPTPTLLPLLTLLPHGCTDTPRAWGPTTGLPEFAPRGTAAP